MELIIVLSKVTIPLINWIAELMGLIMNGVYCLMDLGAFHNIGVCMILYTIVIYSCMIPLTIKQQKLAKMTAYMNPEMNKIKKKYQGKTDQESRMKQQEETMAVYQKYGVSPYGSCLPLVIQLPLLFALYGVIQHIPGYISKVADIFSGLAVKTMCVPDGVATLAKFISENKITLEIGDALSKNNVIDMMYKMTPQQWEKFQALPQFSGLTTEISQVAEKSVSINNFLGMNITESPIEAIGNNAAAGTWWMIIIIILVPVLAWFTQWINFKLTPQSSASDVGGMKAMNNFMPIFSAAICLTFSLGIGIYWIAGAVCRCVQMVVINRQFMKVDIQEMIDKNLEKKKAKEQRKKEAGKKGAVQTQRVLEQAKTNTKNINEPKGKYTNTKEEVIDYYEKAKNARPGSILARANMVKKFEEENPTKAANKNTGNKKKSSGKKNN